MRMTADTAALPHIRQANKAETAEFFGVSLPTIDAWDIVSLPVTIDGAKV